MNNNLKRILNILCTIILIVGIFSKHLHYPGASAEIVLSTALIIILTCINSVMNKEKFNIIIGLSLCVMFFGAMFKAQHWPGASSMAGFGVGLAIAIALLMSFRKENVQLSQQNGLSVFLLLIFVVTLMANNPLQHMLEKEPKQPTPADSRIYGGIKH